MCGIAGLISLTDSPAPKAAGSLELMNELQAHRGPDGQGTWIHSTNRLGLAHRRLSIIDLETGAQPMNDPDGFTITYNGEIYNYIELRKELGEDSFRTTSDTEVILRAYKKWGQNCVQHLRGMFAFAIWDDNEQRLFCARDRFGVKPFYYARSGNTLYFASEIKALLPFLPSIDTDLAAFKDYLTFQFCLDGKTLFRDVSELKPAHLLTVTRGAISIRRYWEVYFHIDPHHTAEYFRGHLLELLEESVRVHLRSDVPLGAYLSGGLDSGVIASMSRRCTDQELLGFNGKFSWGQGYDESEYAQLTADHAKFDLHVKDIDVSDFLNNIDKVVYHLDQPTAGPGSFPQYMVSQLASQHRKVVLGGQGGDEIFGGYTRYLVAYFEQCIKSAIEGTATNDSFVVTYESIIPNLITLKNYKPMLKQFWREGLFEDMDRRYFRLVNRAPELEDVVNWDDLSDYSPFESFRSLFYGENVGKQSYFDLMTHFDFKTLLPALLHVEDRMSMAHGLESRVPLLDHALVECASTIPADIKFRDGTMKHIFRLAYGDLLPDKVLHRKDKMGFPTPFTEWAQGPARDYMFDLLGSNAAKTRDLIDNKTALGKLEHEGKFGRSLWGVLCLEIWQRNFHDRSAHYLSLADKASSDRNYREAT